MKNRRNFAEFFLDEGTHTFTVKSRNEFKREVTISMVSETPKGVSGTGMWSVKIIPEE